ncbi:MAG: hypothetical protein WAJ87_22865 [Bryobacteraceae bacterium]
MRYLLSGRLPEASSILLVESGSRGILENVIAGLRHSWGADVPIDLVSCFANLPRGLDAATTRVYRVSDYRGRQARARLYRELRARRYPLMGIVCSEEPLMMKWKWALALRVPAKIFIINENADYFWLDRKHLKTIRQFALARAGLAGSGAVRTLARVVSFPFALFYLLLYAAAVHGRRALRVRFRRVVPAS